MEHKIRLGPIAVFLTVIAAVLATLAMLTVATSRADYTLAERFAAVTGIRYRLEAEGNRFLQQMDQAVAKLSNAETVSGGEAGAEADIDAEAVEYADALLAELPEGTELQEDGSCRYYIEEDGYALTIEADIDPAEGEASVSTWKITKIWNGADPFEDFWQGF